VISRLGLSAPIRSSRGQRADARADFAIEHGIRTAAGVRAALARTQSRRAINRETPSHNYAQRTQWNVRDSDATALFTIAAHMQGGTALTMDLAQRFGKPWLHLTANAAESDTTAVQEAAARLSDFLAEHHVKSLNVAGPRASQEPGVADFVGRVLASVWAVGNARNL
jgi:hypothetical protein